MRTLFSGEYRRAAILGAIGAPMIVALLLFRLVGSGESAIPPVPARLVLPTPAVPSPGVIVPAAPVPAPSPPIDPALLRDPFCPLVVAAAAAGSAPVECGSRTITPGLQAIGLQDIFGEGGVLLARINVGPLTFPNLHEGDAVAGFRVVSLSDRCGEFEFGGSPLSLCEGEQVIK